MLSRRERMMRALRREIPDQAPRHITLTPALIAVVKQKTGKKNWREYFKLEGRPVEIKPTELQTDFSGYFPEDDYVNPADTGDDWSARQMEWGVRFLSSSTRSKTLYHYNRMVHPMKDFLSIKDLEEYPFPDMTAEYRYEGLEREVRELQKRDFAVMNASAGSTVFEMAYFLRGMENLLVDFFMNKDFATVLLDKIMEIRCGVVKRVAAAGVDILLFGDDIGGQRDMMMSPFTWRTWIKPRFAKIIESARAVKPDIITAYHSDGNYEPVIPELIEIGVNVLLTVQAEAMDPVKLKQLYGDKLAFWGTIGTQSTMLGSVEDIKKEVEHQMKTVGKGGGLVLGPSIILQPDVPWENVIGLVEACDQFGKYET